MNTKFSHEINALDTLLDHERSLLLSGDLEGLRTIVAEKDRLIQDLAKNRSETSENLLLVSERLKKNSKLLSSAMDGIRHVAKSLSDLSLAERQLKTYDRNGEERSISSRQSEKLEKRA